MKSRLARAGAVGAMAIGAVVVVSSFGAPGGAQADATTAIPNPGYDQAPAVSHDGRTIVFTSSVDAAGEDTSIVVHDRGPLAPDGSVLAATTSPIADTSGAVNPSISGDGCVVVWSVPAVTAASEPQPAASVDDPSDSVPDDPSDSVPSDSVVGDAPAEVEAAALQAAPARLVALDLCADPVGARVDLPLTDADLSFGPAATSLDGAIIAISNGTDVIRFTRTAAGGYVEADRFDGRDTDATDHLVGERVDMSDDGSVVVFAAGTDLQDPTLMTVFARVEGESAPTPLLTAATAPSVSADGALVVASTGVDGSSVTLVDRATTPLAPVDLGPGRRPMISADGNHVVVEEGANLAMVSRTGQGDVAFATTQRTLLSATISPTRSGPVVDQIGATVVSDLGFDVAAPPADTDVSITLLPADASFDAAMFDLGKGDIGTTLSTTVTFSNRGPSSVGVAGVGVDGTFAIADDRCGALVRPGTTCEVDVTFSVERLEDAFGVVTLTPTSFGVDPYTTEVAALGEAPPVSTASTTTTTTPGSSTGGSTGGTSTGGSTTGGRGSTGGSSTTGSTSSTGGRSTSGSSSGGGTSATTTIAPGAGVSASPAVFDFAPTIIDAGRRTGLVEIVNNSSSAITVVGVGLDPAEAGPFQIVETTCVDASVAAGARCGITLSFAPTDTGALSATLLASLDGDTDITVPVTGVGAAPPTVSVIPGVATVGQVVTLSGAGFPTGITVDITWASTEYSVDVSDAGTFNLPVVLMSHTPTGPADVSVAGQTDMFATTTGTVLVTRTTDRSVPPVIDGIGPNIGR